jgi:hypothetical protein
MTAMPVTAVITAAADMMAATVAAVDMAAEAEAMADNLFVDQN